MSRNQFTMMVTRFRWVRVRLVFNMSPTQYAPCSLMLFPFKLRTSRDVLKFNDSAKAAAPSMFPELPVRCKDRRESFTCIAFERNINPFAVIAFPERCSTFKVEFTARLVAKASVPASPIELKPSRWVERI